MGLRRAHSGSVDLVSFLKVGGKSGYRRYSTDEAPGGEPAHVVGRGACDARLVPSPGLLIIDKCVGGVRGRTDGGRRKNPPPGQAREGDGASRGRNCERLCAHVHQIISDSMLFWYARTIYVRCLYECVCALCVANQP